MSGRRRCPGCGERKPQDEFTGKPPWLCRECYREYRSGGMASVRQTRELREYHDALAAQQWRERIAAASLAERGRHELALEKQKEQRREKRKDRWAIAVYLATNLDRHVVTPAGKVVLEALAAPFMLVRWMWAQLFGKA